MSKVPAWKRLGLQVKTEVEEDPLATTVHLESDTLTNKLAKKLNKKRRAEETKSDTQKKPPKRPKLPKTERGPPPEKDQLAYLRQFSKDKANWKFSKQKQNWLLKNMETIPDSYEKELVEYVEGIQGGARERVAADLRAVVDKWNEYAKKLEEKINAELYGEKTEEKEEVKEETGPSKEYAARCVKILRALVEEEVEFYGEDEKAEEAGEKEEEKVEKEEDKEEVEEEKQEEKSEEKSEEEKEEEDNLIIEEVHAEDYAETPKKSKKEKKEKKKRVRIVEP